MRDGTEEPDYATLGARHARQTRSQGWPVSAVVGAGAAVIGVSALSLLGLLALGMDETRVRTLVPILASLASGAVIGGAIFELIPEAIARHARPMLVGIEVAGGFVGFWMLERVLHRTANRRSPSTATLHQPVIALNLIGDGLHNAADGSIIAAAFLANPTIGVVTTLAIVLHEIPRELGSFGIFMHGGLSVRRAALYNGLTGVTALIGAGITLLAGTRTTGVATLLLPIAAGTFLYIGVSIAPGAILSAPSLDRRIRRLMLALLALAGTAAAARLG